MLIGILDVDADAWIQQGGFWAGQKVGPTAKMLVSFHLPSRKKVRVILSNWRPNDGSSSWTLKDLRIVRGNG
jgi:hypothetical protein